MKMSSIDLILASGDRVALDVESIRIRSSFEGSKLVGDPWNYNQIQRAVRLGLGVTGKKDYRLVSG